MIINPSHPGTREIPAATSRLIVIGKQNSSSNDIVGSPVKGGVGLADAVKTTSLAAAIAPVVSTSHLTPLTAPSTGTWGSATTTTPPSATASTTSASSDGGSLATISNKEGVEPIRQSTLDAGRRRYGLAFSRPFTSLKEILTMSFISHLLTGKRNCHRMELSLLRHLLSKE